MTFIVLYSISVVANLLLFLFVAQIVPCKLNIKKTVLLAAVYALFLIPKFLFGIYSSTTIIFNLGALAVLIAIPILFYRGKLWKRLLVFFWFWMMQFSSDATFVPLLVGKREFTYTELQPATEWLRYGCITLSVFIALALISLLAFRMMFLHKFRSFYLLFFLYPFSLIFFAYNLAFTMDEWVWAAGMILGLTAELTLLFYVIDQEKKAELEEELKSVRHMMELEQAHYKMVEERREELAKIRHDFNNHLAIISRLVRLGEDEDAQELISRLAESIERTRENPYCGISVVNAVLSEKEEECAGRNILLETELELPPESGIEPLHLCSIFSNLMDNAIKGCVQSGVEEPLIRLASRLDGDYLFIKTENPSMLPGKEPDPGHGYGTKILAGIAQEYGGDYAGSYEDGKYIAIVSLSLCGMTPARPDRRVSGSVKT